MIPGIEKYIEDGLISVQSHPEFPELVIYNYTPACQYAGAWDEVTTRCRGLIFNTKTGEQLSNPFPKFFNYEEYTQKGWPIPNEEPIITDKLDGWCGISYIRPDGKVGIATRGSFASTGAVWATAWAQEYLEPLDPRYTYVFEIISPETKIVLDYKFTGLVLLARRPLKEGAERERLLHIKTIDLIPYFAKTPPNYGGSDLVGCTMRIAEVFPSADFATLKAMNLENKEGFVLWYPQADKRIKIKFEDYVRLHKIMTGLSAIGIWEALAQGQELSIENVPDEFYQWFNETKQGLLDQFAQIKMEALVSFGNVRPEMTRKEAAEVIKLNPHAGIVFAMLDGKPYEHIIWKMIRPHGVKVFKTDVN